MSWWGSQVRQPPIPALVLFHRFIDGLFGKGHCFQDYQRIQEGRPIAPNWRECGAAFAIVLTPIALITYGLWAMLT